MSDKLRIEWQDRIAHELTKSSITTNESVKILSDKTLDNFIIQKRLTKASLLVAASSALFVAISICFMATDNTAKELKGNTVTTAKSIEGTRTEQAKSKKN
jgi:hypothetical protein